MGCACALLIAMFSLVSTLHADGITNVDCDTFEFSFDRPDVPVSPSESILVASSAFSLTNADISSIVFEANFDVIDAGVRIDVNGLPLFATGADVSEFGPGGIFNFPTLSTTDTFIQNPFGPNDSSIPRLTVLSDSTGTTFSGSQTTTAASPAVFAPLFNVGDFTGLLAPGDNVIEIFVLNGFGGANLSGDFTVTQTAEAVPEPTSLSLCLVGGLMLAARRRR